MPLSAVHCMSSNIMSKRGLFASLDNQHDRPFKHSPPLTDPAALLPSVDKSTNHRHDILQSATLRPLWLAIHAYAYDCLNSLVVLG